MCHLVLSESPAEMFIERLALKASEHPSARKVLRLIKDWIEGDPDATVWPLSDTSDNESIFLDTILDSQGFMAFFYYAKAQSSQIKMLYEVFVYPPNSFNEEEIVDIYNVFGKTWRVEHRNRDSEGDEANSVLRLFSIDLSIKMAHRSILARLGLSDLEQLVEAPDQAVSNLTTEPVRSAPTTATFYDTSSGDDRMLAVTNYPEESLPRGPGEQRRGRVGRPEDPQGLAFTPLVVDTAERYFVGSHHLRHAEGVGLRPYLMHLMTIMVSRQPQLGIVFGQSPDHGGYLHDRGHVYYQGVERDEAAGADLRLPQLEALGGVRQRLMVCAGQQSSLAVDISVWPLVGNTFGEGYAHVNADRTDRLRTARTVATCGPLIVGEWGRLVGTVIALSNEQHLTNIDLPGDLVVDTSERAFKSGHERHAEGVGLRPHLMDIMMNRQPQLGMVFGQSPDHGGYLHGRNYIYYQGSEQDEAAGADHGYLVADTSERAFKGGRLRHAEGVGLRPHLMDIMMSRQPQLGIVFGESPDHGGHLHGPSHVYYQGFEQDEAAGRHPLNRGKDVKEVHF